MFSSAGVSVSFKQGNTLRLTELDSSVNISQTCAAVLSVGQNWLSIIFLLHAAT